jgi:hypothetical protein
LRNDQLAGFLMGAVIVGTLAYALARRARAAAPAGASPAPGSWLAGSGSPDRDRGGDLLVPDGRGGMVPML